MRCSSVISFWSTSADILPQRFQKITRFFLHMIIIYMAKFRKKTMIWIWIICKHGWQQISLKWTKTKSKLLFSFQLKKKQWIKFWGNVLKTENYVWYLGVQKDRNLSFTENIRNVEIRCAKFISFLYLLETCYRLNNSWESTKETYNKFIKIENWFVTAPQKQV